MQADVYHAVLVDAHDGLALDVRVAAATGTHLFHATLPDAREVGVSVTLVPKADGLVIALLRTVTAGALQTCNVAGGGQIQLPKAETRIFNFTPCLSPGMRRSFPIGTFATLSLDRGGTAVECK